MTRRRRDRSDTNAEPQTAPIPRARVRGAPVACAPPPSQARRPDGRGPGRMGAAAELEASAAPHVTMVGRRRDPRRRRPTTPTTTRLSPIGTAIHGLTPTLTAQEVAPPSPPPGAGQPAPRVKRHGLWRSIAARPRPVDDGRGDGAAAMTQIAGENRPSRRWLVVGGRTLVQASEVAPPSAVSAAGPVPRVRVGVRGRSHRRGDLSERRRVPGPRGVAVRSTGRSGGLRPQSFPERTSRRDGQNLNDADGLLAMLRRPGLWQRHQVRNTD
jgi:hypothetical protein